MVSAMTQDQVLRNPTADATAQPAYFVRDGSGYAPTWIAQGPWGETIAGQVVGGLLGWTLERVGGEHDLQPARLTVDLLRPVALKPVEVEASIQRQGRRIRLVDAVLTQNGTVVARASALFLRRGEQPAGQVWSAPVTMPPVPTEPEQVPDSLPMMIHTFGWGSAAITADPRDPAVSEHRRSEVRMGA
jgi:hypothetical protein